VPLLGDVMAPSGIRFERQEGCPCMVEGLAPASSYPTPPKRAIDATRRSPAVLGWRVCGNLLSIIDERTPSNVGSSSNLYCWSITDHRQCRTAARLGTVEPTYTECRKIEKRLVVRRLLLG